MSGWSVVEMMRSARIESPLLSDAIRFAELAALARGRDPYEFMSYALSALSLFAYAAAQHQRSKGLVWVRPPKNPVVVEIRRNSLPENMLDMFVDRIARYVEFEVRQIVDKLSRRHGVEVEYVLPHVYMVCMAAISRHRIDVEAAFRELTELLEKMKSRAGTSRVALSLELIHDDLVPEDLLKQGYKRIKVVAGNHWSTDMERFREVAKELGFEVEESQSSEFFRHVIARKRFGEVELAVECGSDRFGWVVIEFIDRLPEIPRDVVEAVEVDNIVLKPYPLHTAEIVKEVAEKAVEEASTVERYRQIFEKMIRLIYTARVEMRDGKPYIELPLEIIGIEPGDTVKIVVDREQRRIVIEPEIENLEKEMV